MISTASAGRVALVDGQDVANQRPVDAELGASGGASPYQGTAPYVSQVAGNALILVTTVAGNTRARVSGYEIQS